MRRMSARSHRLQPRPNLGRRSKPNHPIRPEVVRVTPAPREVRPQRSDHERVPPDECGPPRLAVAMPQFFSRAEPSEGPSKEAGQPDPDGEVEPDDDVRTVEEQCSELGAVDRG